MPDYAEAFFALEDVGGVEHCSRRRCGGSSEELEVVVICALAGIDGGKMGGKMARLR